ncbi:HTH-type transcriptional regulator LrpA [Candidatus Bilamarchaeum dharawalense]|uniref:HTH-type transcriptional regulator LrpA n=1 Tax=Candidatus Bilamarchaeum dharawalense TaxID=2885759 RepID=A0A5E4LPE8_9ARCH|nr:HTH-type transcriptional regulator LrpA [Candidatus Bilamarchaeum dharawalense]
MSYDLDLVDRKILSELDTNARMNYSEIGKKIRVAKETVKYRIGQLQNKKIISGFYTVLNFSKLGFTLYRTYIRLQNTSPKIENEIGEYLINSKNIAIFYRTNGPFQIALAIWAKTPWEHEQFWLNFKNKFGEYLADYHLSVMVEYLEFTRSYLLPSKSNEKKIFTTIIKTEPETLDKLDFALLTFLSDNARASLVEIAKELRISVVTARYRLKNLINKKVIVGFRPVFNLSALGREYYKVDLWFRKFDNANEVMQKILSHPNVIYTEKSLITSDFEFDVEVENFEKFTEMMESFKAKFPEDIRTYRYYSLVKNLKTNYAPEL